MEKKITRTPEEIERRLKGIIASASFEDLESSPEDIKMLRRLGNGEITESEYLGFYGIK